MTRTILEKNNQTWLDSDAHKDRKIPLNIQMGAGQLNAFRAYQQFSPGQWAPTQPVPAIGWNYGKIQAKESYQDYVISSPLRQGSYVAATLVWNRLVELNDRNKNGDFDLGESFRDRGLNKLDIYLMRAEETDIRKNIWSSISEIDNVQHIFYPVPATGRYKIRVVFRKQMHESVQPYALAWWTAPASSSVSPKP
jgi:hypothetical protein